MKRFKAIIALLLVLTMVFSLAACGGAKKASVDSGKPAEGSVIDPEAKDGGGIIKDEFVEKKAEGLADSVVEDAPIQLPKYTLPSTIVAQLGTDDEARVDLFANTYASDVEFVITSPVGQLNKVI